MQNLAEKLTERERQVLIMLCQRLSNREIAESLTLSLGTVKWYVRQIFNKLGVTNRREAAKMAENSSLMRPTIKTIHQIPARITSFVGREREIADITHLLIEEGRRLVSLTGLGGMGKTRLALEIAHRLQPTFTDGVRFVDLQSVNKVNLLPAAIAEAFGIPLHSHEDPMQQILAHLQHLDVLIVLDHFEHLIPCGGPCSGPCDSAAVLLALLADTTGVRLLVTSREALNIPAEWLYPLSGLHGPDCIPADGMDSGLIETDNPETHDAAQLFVERARQVDPAFSHESGSADIHRICRLVEGMPLAIELAASWCKTLTCAEIADEIEHSIQFLTARQYSIPHRHRSIQAIFEPTWSRLSPHERDIFISLTALEGSFTRAAAQAASGASLLDLSRLVDKSLLRVTAGKRYHIHKLLRRYSAEQLTPDRQRPRQTRQNHAEAPAHIHQPTCRHAQEGFRRYSVSPALGT